MLKIHLKFLIGMILSVAFMVLAAVFIDPNLKLGHLNVYVVEPVVAFFTGTLLANMLLLFITAERVRE